MTETDGAFLDESSDALPREDGPPGRAAQSVAIAATPAPLEITNVDDLKAVTRILHASSVALPSGVKTLADAAAIILAGHEMGIGPMTSLRSIHIVEGKATLSASLILAFARRAGWRHKWLTRSSDAERAAIILRRDGEEHEEEFTIDDARRAKLVPGKAGAAWTKYPQRMLRWRAVSGCVNSACPEVLFGSVYVPGELGGPVSDADLNAPPVEAELVERTEKPVPRTMTPEYASQIIDALRGEKGSQWVSRAKRVLDFTKDECSNELRQSIEAAIEEADATRPSRGPSFERFDESDACPT